MQFIKKRPTAPVDFSKLVAAGLVRPSQRHAGDVADYEAPEVPEVLGKSRLGWVSTTYPSGAKQPNTSLTAAPILKFPYRGSGLAQFRVDFDSIITFATSIGANQGVALPIDRLKAYATRNGRRSQILEIEGVALDAAAYLANYIALRRGGVSSMQQAGKDPALANTTQGLSSFMLPDLYLSGEDPLLQLIEKVQPYTGVGAASAYSVNGIVSATTGTGKYTSDATFVARSFSSRNFLQVQQALGFLIMVDNADIAALLGAVRVGELTLSLQQLITLEDEFNALVQAASIAGLGTVFANHALQPPKNSFTGNPASILAMVLDEPTDVQVTLSSSQLVNVAVFGDATIGDAISA